MGKTGRWIKSFLSGKKGEEKNEHPTTQISTTPKEKKRWSFRRSSATVPPASHQDFSTTLQPPSAKLDSENDHNKLHAMARISAAAVKIQAVFRGYLSRKALNALKGLVKLQALVRGHLVRKQAAATLKCIQALITAQARARAQRMTEDGNPRQSLHRKSTHTYQDYEEGIKIVEMEHGESKGRTKSYSNQGQIEQRFSTHKHISPAPSAITDQSPRACSGHFEEYTYGTAQSSPQYYSTISQPDPSKIPFLYARSEYAESLYNQYALYPSYMANTESSRAKVRSHSAPKQRHESFERQPSRQRQSIEGRTVPRAVRMQRPSSHVGSAARNYQYPCSIKLDGSNISIKDSECGSNCSVLTTQTKYCTSLVGFDV